MDYDELAAEFLLDRARLRQTCAKWRQFHDTCSDDGPTIVGSSTDNVGTAGRSTEISSLDDLLFQDTASSYADSNLNIDGDVNRSRSRASSMSSGPPTMVASSVSSFEVGSDGDSDVDDNLSEDDGGDGDSATGGNFEKRGGGGRWRAYVRHRTLGEQGTPNLKQIAEDYWRVFVCQILFCQITAVTPLFVLS